MNNYKYQRAENFLPWNLRRRVLNSTIFPYWASDALYYFQELSTGTILIRIDTKNGNKEKIINLQDLLSLLASRSKDELTLEYIPLDKFSIHENPLQLRFAYQNINWFYNLQNHVLTQEAELEPGYLQSPDCKWKLYIKDNNLFLNDAVLHNDLQLTTDGEPFYDYASSPETNTYTVTQRIEGSVSAPIAIWSPDSNKIVTHKLDQRKVHPLYLLQNSPSESQRPELYSYRMSFSGDENVPLEELVIIDVSTRSVTPLKIKPLLAPYLTPIEFKWVWWSDNNMDVYFLREARAAKELSLCVADSQTGSVDVLISESSETYVEPSQHFPCPLQVIILEDRQEIIWLSERSGYAHLYLYDKGINVPKNAITHGEWCVKELHFYDDKENWLYFTATGYDKDIDPYYKQLLRCHLDGSEVQCLTEGNVNHTIYISPQKKCFLDTFSTINSAPVSILKRMDGSVISHVETADINGLTELGWIPPMRFSEKGRDGVTDIYGNLYFPTDFDPNKKYPLIDHIYPGPQFYRTPQHFNIYGAIFRSAWTAQALAELGFIVLHTDGMGTPGRSKAFHDATYKNISDCGIPDHVAVIKSLASKYKYIDIEKIGVTGYSGGGYAAVRAMLMFPDFYKIAVAAAGNHDLRCYPANYGEKYNSLDTNTYADQSNTSLANNLQGQLLLIHGEMDDNVHPCATMQLVDSLIKYNKDFDMLIMPNQNHTTTFDHPYYMRRHWDYFVRHFLNEIPPKNYSIRPMPSDFPQENDW